MTYPNYEKIFLHYLKIRINIDQYQENCKYRICLARMKKSLSLTQGLSARSGWDDNVSRPSTNTGWNVLWEHAGVLDEPVNVSATTGTVETKNLRQKTIDLFIPINRVLQTATMQPANSEAAWYQGTTTADFTYLHVDTDDATDVDSEYLTFNVFYEYKFTSIS